MFTIPSIGRVLPGLVLVLTSMVATPAAARVAAAAPAPIGAPSSEPPPQLRAKGVSGGVSHACAVTVRGGVLCWGENNYGGLGDGTTSNSSVPVEVRGLGARVKQVYAGYHFTCALTVRGGVKCWGLNRSGVLGNNSRVDSTVPVDVVGLRSGVRSVDVGQAHVCVITVKGGLKCWGFNGYGALGNNSRTDATVPVDVVGLTTGVRDISAGTSSTCAVTRSHRALCWGYNYYGQLGNGTTTSSLTPVPVSLPQGVRHVSVGAFSACAVNIRGAVTCWGDNAKGQLGNNSTTNLVTPVGVHGLGSGVRSVSTGREHACALTFRGVVLCWGENRYGQLGDGSFTLSPVPVVVADLERVRRLTTGSWFTCVLTVAKAVRCWGDNSVGELGNNSTWDSPTPVTVTGF